MGRRDRSKIVSRGAVALLTALALALPAHAGSSFDRLPFSVASDVRRNAAITEAVARVRKDLAAAHLPLTRRATAIIARRIVAEARVQLPGPQGVTYWLPREIALLQAVGVAAPMTLRFEVVVMPDRGPAIPGITICTVALGTDAAKPAVDCAPIRFGLRRRATRT